MSTTTPVPQASLERLLPAVLGDAVAALDSADLGAPVAGCPGWRVVDLAGHLGDVHRWAAAALRAADPAAGPPDPAPDPAPTDARERQALLAWSARQADDLQDALDEAGPDAPAWGFGPPPRTSAFWWRRMVHETTLHTWDVRAAQRSGPPWTVSDDPVLALDGIDEVTSVFLPRQVRSQRCAPLPAAIRLSPTDEPDGPGWLLRGDGTLDPRDAAAPADVVLHGPADALLLVLWHRLGLDDERLHVEGDPAVAADLLDRPLVP
ncbi:maleylpyruvate isomerase family mycothiol-dependent enzyme [Nocardioides sp. AX2bis]|uniref:maleylpyruvate isomerase family mycothiol-dependent enzyme n=1 Tax=Nocardioides sp. AX2bis TaxID=2653157 RepID=UPI0012F0AABF|nr:maleylpyruvate isomerase family mycothiol-dependent enzyme [Nocardioides sp. AX2bis]VXA99565.1 conserved hypothetical protein [Nocardioides sp. AX2bis]